MRRRSVGVVTSGRSDYGLLYWIIKQIDAEPDLDLRLFVTGAHLSEIFGLTVGEIEADGFGITQRIDIELDSGTPRSITRSMGLGTIGFGDAFDEYRPDIVLLLGDRFEILSAAQAAVVSGIPLAHIHGGEITEGAYDDHFRHAITKLSTLHFVSTEDHRRRVIQMGESPDRVWNFGAPGVEHITKTRLLSLTEVSRALGHEIHSPFFLVTYHPVTLSTLSSVDEIAELFAALDRFPDYSVVFTYPNADAGGKGLIEAIEEYSLKNASRVKCFKNLGQTVYLSLLQACSAVVGNSSSGIIEAPTLKKPTVDIGDRQKGRTRGDTVINTGCNAAEIVKAIDKAISDGFALTLIQAKNPYGGGDVSGKIVSKLRSIDLAGLRRKTFHEYGR